MSLLDEKVIQSKEIKKLVDFLVKESRINHANPKELGLPEFRIVVREDGSCYGHVMGRSSTTVDFKLPIIPQTTGHVSDISKITGVYNVPNWRGKPYLLPKKKQ